MFQSLCHLTDSRQAELKLASLPSTTPPKPTSFHFQQSFFPPHFCTSAWALHFPDPALHPKQEKQSITASQVSRLRTARKAEGVTSPQLLPFIPRAVGIHASISSLDSGTSFPWGPGGNNPAALHS